MTEPQTITPELLQSLLDAESGDAILGLVEGQFQILDGARADGALEVVSRADLAERLGDDPSDDELARHAVTLMSAVDHLGG